LHPPAAEFPIGFRVIKTTGIAVITAFRNDFKQKINIFKPAY
jgi:hypothetical protein